MSNSAPAEVKAFQMGGSWGKGVQEAPHAAWTARKSHGHWAALPLHVPYFPRTPLPGYLPRDPELTILTQLGRFLSSVP